MRGSTQTHLSGVSRRRHLPHERLLAPSSTRHHARTQRPMTDLVPGLTPGTAMVPNSGPPTHWQGAIKDGDRIIWRCPHTGRDDYHIYQRGGSTSALACAYNRLRWDQARFRQVVGLHRFKVVAWHSDHDQSWRGTLYSRHPQDQRWQCDHRHATIPEARECAQGELDGRLRLLDDLNRTPGELSHHFVAALDLDLSQL
jgi:hypothetical protein